MNNLGLPLGSYVKKGHSFVKQNYYEHVKYVLSVSLSLSRDH